MTGFELRVSGVESDSSTNCARAAGPAINFVVTG